MLKKKQPITQRQLWQGCQAEWEYLTPYIQSIFTFGLLLLGSSHNVRQVTSTRGPVRVSYEWISFLFVFFLRSSPAILLAAAATCSLLSQLKGSRPAPQVTRFPQVTSKSWSVLNARLASFRITAEIGIRSFVGHWRVRVFFLREASGLQLFGCSSLLFFSVEKKKVLKEEKKI